MNNQQFEELLASVKEMGKHMRGIKVPGAVTREFPDPDPNHCNSVTLPPLKNTGNLNPA